jgi:Transposase DDE domain
MKGRKGYVAGYNGQLVVTDSQVIVGVMLSQHPVDRTQLHTVLDLCRHQLSAAGITPKLHTVLADSGYVSEDNFLRAERQKPRLLAPLTKDPSRHKISDPAGPAQCRQAARHRRASRPMQHHRGRADYKMRGRTVEPVVVNSRPVRK